MNLIIQLQKTIPEMVYSDSKMEIIVVLNTAVVKFGLMIKMT